MIFSQNSLLKSSKIIIFLALTSCNGSMFTGRSLEGKNTTTSSNEMPTAVANDTGMIQKNEWFNVYSKASFDYLKTVSMSAYISAARDRMSNEEVEIASQSLFDLKNFTDRHDEIYQDAGVQYPTIGDFFDALGVTSSNDVQQENVYSGYQKLADAYLSGIIDKFLSNSFMPDLTDQEIVSAKNLDRSENFDLLKTVVATALLLPRSPDAQFALLDENVPAVAAVAVSESDKHGCVTFSGTCTIGHHKHVDSGGTSGAPNSTANPIQPAAGDSNTSNGCSHGICLVD